MQKSFARFLWSGFFPKRCPYCRNAITDDEYACPDCIESFPEEPIKSGAIGGYPCLSSFLYKDEYRSALLRFKFKNKKIYGESFAVSIASDIRKVYNDIKFDYITSVPMYYKSLKSREYNHAEVLARNIGERLGVEYAELLVKTKQTRVQHFLTRSERIKNVRGIYQTNKTINVKGKTILLCDDVITTGSTLGSCAGKLERAGAKRVYCVTLLKR